MDLQSLEIMYIFDKTHNIYLHNQGEISHT